MNFEVVLNLFFNIKFKWNKFLTSVLSLKT
jgi:hypothetical protein